MKMFQSPREIEALKILDTQRLHGYWKSKEALFAQLERLLCHGGADYSVYPVPDWGLCPKRDDWPGWNHVGNHPVIGRQFWDWFHFHFPNYILSMSDQPDFNAICYASGRTHFIVGDIGQVSPQAFMFALNGKGPGDVWISILDNGNSHVVITLRDQFLSQYSTNPQRTAGGNGPSSHY